MGDTADIPRRVAAEEQTDPLDLPPLYDSIDAEALERCVEPTDDSATFRFTYCLYTGVVRGDGAVSLDPDARGETRPADTPTR